MSIVSGASLKLADLGNEHSFIKKHWSEKYFFSLVWGGSTILLLHHSTLNFKIFLIALLFSFLTRGKFDYLNHGIGISIIIIYMMSSSFYSLSFEKLLIIYPLLLLLGLVHDYLPFNKLICFKNYPIEKKNKTLFIEYAYSLVAYIVLPMILSFIWCDEDLFIGIFCWILGYDIVRYFYLKKMFYFKEK
jgi:hypothetical protein